MWFRHLVLTFLTVAAITPTGYAQTQPAGQSKPGPQQAKYMIFLVDYSKSIEDLEDTTQAMISHLISLADLSGEQVKMAVIFFGGQGVQVVAENGMPTSAYKTLQAKLLKSWPKPSGATPLDSAKQKALQMISALPAGSDVSVVLITDGEPYSGYLRPDDFPEVKKELERQRKAVEDKYRDFDAATIQRQLAQWEIRLQTPDTEEFKKLYQLQLPGELQKTLEYARAIQKAGARFISVDYGNGIPALKQIHEVAGGKPSDLIIAQPPSSVIAKLHQLGLTALPSVIVQQPVRIDADPKSFEKGVNLKLDAVGERALVTWVFEPGIADFGKHAAIDAKIGGSTMSFSTANDDPNCILSRDSAGKVVAAHLKVDPLPADGQVLLIFRSPGSSLAVPASTIYIHLRTHADLVPEFRPSHLPTDAKAPHSVSPNHQAKWVSALRSRSNPKPYPAKGIEAILRNHLTGAEQRIGTIPDAQAPNCFASAPIKIPRGNYDAVLYVTLESGAQVQLRLSGHVQSLDTEECVTVEITQKAGDKTEHASQKRGHIDFGEVGDDRTKATAEFTIRSKGIDYPITVDLTIDGLVDRQGGSSRQAWLVPNRKQIVLHPGRAEKLLLTLKLPDSIEDALVDGPFQGTVNFTRTDLNTTLPVRRFQPITGVLDDEAVNLVTFALRRPQLLISVPRCYRDTLKSQKDGRMVLRIPVDVCQPFRRDVTVEVSHTSVLARQLTARASAIFRDAEGRQVPGLRLVAKIGEPTQEIAPGGSTTWTLLFEIDRDVSIPKSTGELVVSGPGLPTVYVDVEVTPRRPLLGQTIQNSLSIAAAGLGVLGIVALVRYLRARQLRDGKSIILTGDAPVADLLALRHGRQGRAHLLALQPVHWRFRREPRSKPLGSNRPLPIDIEKLSPSNPLIVEQESTEGEEGMVLSLEQFSPEPPEVHGEILSAPEQMHKAAALGRKTWRHLVLAGLAFVLALTLFTPVILEFAQWLVELLAL